MRAAAVTLLAALALAGCGRVGPPRPPGPLDQVTYPRVYPAPTPEERAQINARRAAQGLRPLPGLELPGTQ